MIVKGLNLFVPHSPKSAVEYKLIIVRIDPITINAKIEEHKIFLFGFMLLCLNPL
jgi:hypothetical protein